MTISLRGGDLFVLLISPLKCARGSFPSDFSFPFAVRTVLKSLEFFEVSPKPAPLHFPVTLGVFLHTQSCTLLPFHQLIGSLLLLCGSWGAALWVVWRWQVGFFLHLSNFAEDLAHSFCPAWRQKSYWKGRAATTPQGGARGEMCMRQSQKAPECNHAIT